nr:immunoglobulin heavy chain junction region [Macaca mulatta]MOX00260.1 immunoglobulin heavy chain junction region [Macaca mulatta]MOX00945.1 immunoglobulin heavy chain junction region [Macaca mulatta]MOX02547.1 immunoglobulin heavy chain junction region [Macaca mulatta]MOX04392.1 immunoglobulin heavy chain junction region [Macaca mulatta]
CTRGGQDFDYW